MLYVLLYCSTFTLLNNSLRELKIEDFYLTGWIFKYASILSQILIYGNYLAHPFNILSHALIFVKRD